MKLIWRKIWNYISFNKPDPNAPEDNFNLRTMHVINRISIFVFILGLGILLYKWYFR